MADPGKPVIGVVAGQHCGNQLRAQSVIHRGLDRRAQRMVDEFERLGAAGLFGGPGMCYPCLVVAVGIAVTADFAPNDGAVAESLYRRSMMTMLERAIAAAANAVGADPEDLRGLATGARLREWQPGEWLFHESTP